MALADMIRLDEEALICDLAETYGIYDYRSLPSLKVAVFFVGLGANSRCKRKLSGMEYPLETVMLAKLCDLLSTLVWFNTEDGQNGTNRPTSILEILLGEESRENISGDFMIFETPEDYEKFMKEKAGG